jgi:hypothetical protein
MAKKNRAPRVEIELIWCEVGEIIPGTGRRAEEERWYDPEKEEGFTRPKYTAWRREQRAKWEKERQERDAMMLS